MIIFFAKDEIAEYFSPSRPKWAEKIVQASGELAGNPHDPRKTRSQTSKDSFASDIHLVEHCYMLVWYNPDTYQQYCNYPICKSAMEDEI